MKTLILTGWFWEDYACAAAVALRRYPEADVMGMSTRRLPEFLSQVSGYAVIIILGVGLVGDPARLTEALKALKKKKVHVRWISAMEPTTAAAGETIVFLDPFIVPGGTLTEAVCKALELTPGELGRLSVEKGKIPPKLKHYHQLLDAAAYYYRNFQDEKAYGNAIRHLSDCDPEDQWSTTEKEMVRQFIRFGHRELQGKSAVIQALHAKIDLIGPKDRARVMILGESGTGKETIALLIHSKSPRHQEPFIAFNCASVNPGLLEDRFFG